jgi:alanyl-tRNA synthetase
MDIESARKEGAMALFGEKYGKTVRVVKMGSFSTELCGGTHCSNTGNIGLFKITSESSVAAGVRRIEAVTGLGVLHLIGKQEALIAQTAAELKVPNANDLAKRANVVMGEIASLKKEIEVLNNKIAASKLDGVLGSAKQIKSVKLIAFNAEGMDVDSARTLGDKIKAEHADTVAVLAVNANGKLNFIAVAGKDAVANGVHAGKLVGAVAAVTGGKGGGRPDSAMAGGADVSKIDEALAKASEIVEGMAK